jgi:predicted CXXCH cytochrome family protein
MLLAVAAVFVGSQACAPCHAAIAKTYALTPMARSSGRVESIGLPDARFTAAGHEYRIEGGRLIFQAGKRDVTVPMDYFIGSGAAGRSFLFERERYLFEIPVTWYARKKIWDASPGYEHEPEVKLNRAVEASCLFCHSSRVRAIYGTQNRYGDTPFLENGVGCERCHGPGSEHVRDPEHARMVNPSKLAPALRDSVCSQCHLTGDVRIERAGRKVAQFQAGEALSERLSESECKRASGDKLWCGTCHDPHAADQAFVTRTKTQAACTECHATVRHKEEIREQLCADCHMPKSSLVDGGHGMMTDHGISLHRKPATSSGGELVAFLGTTDDRSLGLAYAGLGDVRAREYLARAKPADAEVRLRLAALEQDPARAMALYEAVLRENPAQPVALVNLGSLYGRVGKLKEAAELWQRALEANPGIEQAVLNLAEVRPPEEARAILQRYLEFNPGSRAARAKLDGLGR